MAKIVPLFLLLLLGGCGDDTPGSQQRSTDGCSAGMAQVAMGDGYLQNLCGCQEAAGTTAVGSQPFTCTVPNGTTVTFFFPLTRLRHQVLSVGTPSFATGPVYDPTNEARSPAYAVKFSTPGTYNFQDTYQSDLAGRIIVQ